MISESAPLTFLLIALYILGFGIYWARVFSDYQKKKLKDETGYDWDAQMSFYAFLVCVFWPIMFFFVILSAFLPARGSK